MRTIEALQDGICAGNVRVIDDRIDDRAVRLGWTADDRSRPSLEIPYARLLIAAVCALIVAMLVIWFVVTSFPSSGQTIDNYDKLVCQANAGSSSCPQDGASIQ